MKEYFKDHRFRYDIKNIIDNVDRISIEYMNNGYTVTVRQLYYQMIAQDLFPHTWIDTVYNYKNKLPPNTKNTIKNYQKFVKVVSDGRMAGLIDWDVIEDRLRHTIKNTHWTSYDEILKVAVNSWCIDKWSYQKFRIEVMCEKDAVSGILEPVCRKYDVPFTACRGYGSQSLFYRKGREFRNILLDGQPIFILYFGDHDPSGLDMDRDVLSRIREFSYLEDGMASYIHLERLALTKEQIDKFLPPPNPAKSTDSRYRSYYEQFGDESWELDAIKPEYLEKILSSAIERMIDIDMWEKAIEDEEYQRDELSSKVGL